MTDDPVPFKDQICKCDHSAERHLSNGVRLIGANNATWCKARFCSCSKFMLNHIK